MSEAFGVIETAEAEGAARERAAIVAWLRETSRIPGLPYHDARVIAADAIEQGEHSK